MDQCAERERLAAEVKTVLSEIVELTTLQLEHFQAGKNKPLMDADRKLENAVGKKERAMGALRQHTRDHKCG